MASTPHKPASRRDFLKASLAAPIALGAAPAFAARGGLEIRPVADLASAPPLPTRPLGKSGIDVTILNIGGMMAAHNPQFLDLAWSMGIRYFDTADCYKRGDSEKDIARWIERHPDLRPSLFLVTKDHPKTPAQALEMIDRRLEACGAETIDLFLIHALAPRGYGDPEAFEIPKSAEWRQAAEKMKEDGKIKLFGFSCHDPSAPALLQATVEGGWMDAVMIAYNPFMNPNDEMQKALDACHDAGIGIIAMKEMRALGDVPKRIPEFEALGLTTHQAALQAAWSDKRIASICSSIENVQQMEENTAAARGFKEPLTLAHIAALKELAMERSPAMCPNCDGRCQRAAGSRMALNDIARYVAYYEQDGDPSARDFYRSLAAWEREDPAADLMAARAACLSGLDFVRILQRAKRYFA